MILDASAVPACRHEEPGAGRIGVAVTAGADRAPGSGCPAAYAGAIDRDAEPAVRILSSPLTFEEYLALPDDVVHYEVVDGQLVVTASLFGPHQRAVTRLAVRLDAACPAGHEVLVSPIDWVLWQVPRLQIRQPDLAVVTSEQADGPRLTVPPLLVVEVLSPSSFERDVVAKRAEYGRAGARHYWVVNLPAVEVVAYRAAVAGDELVEHARAAGDELLALDEPFPVALRPSDLVRS